ncbi:MAG: hypothetical protein LBI66_11420 [Burkholderiaceae bacterium]|jgi:spermidine synthase|nr:hypothetical protein [Burkholderiaceae bacterium]
MIPLISFVCGLLSLGGEILWVRLFGFANESTPRAFGFVLFCYLIGIALGAEYGKRICKTASHDRLLKHVAMAFFISSLSWLAFPMVYGMVALTPWHLPVAVVLIILSAAIIAYVFPIAHHLGADSGEKQGRKFSKVYVSNVMGAGLGPLIVGWYLLDRFSLHQCFLIICIAAACFAGLLLMRSRPIWLVPIASILIATVWTWYGAGHWLVKNVSNQYAHLKYVNENKHGIITIFEGGKEGDIVYGGNVYDGRTNLDGDLNSNGLHRVLAAHLLQPHPKKVLMIGLSIGSWLALAREFEGVETLDIVEINPGYSALTQHYPAQADALKDPRVHLVVDDARRWLRHHPEKKYDLIIMNNTWHWRAYGSLLLSQEFFTQIKQHMEPDAVMAFNSTYSQDAFFTAQAVFDHAYRLSNFIYAAHQPLEEKFRQPGNVQVLDDFRIQGRRIFAEGSEMPAKILDLPFLDYVSTKRGFERESEIISDENMLTEFKYGKPLFH